MSDLFAADDSDATAAEAAGSSATSERGVDRRPAVTLGRGGRCMMAVSRTGADLIRTSRARRE